MADRLRSDEPAGTPVQRELIPQLVLASRSPRRVALLRQMRLRFVAFPADIDESRHRSEALDDHVMRLSRAKVEWAAARLPERAIPAKLPVLGADTLVVLDDKPLGKPRDRDEALDMLLALAGRTHEVLTAVAVSGLRDGERRTEGRLHRSRVTLRTIAMDEARRYSECGEPEDKAGGYGIQGIGGIFIDRIEGSCSGVMGMPLVETEVLLSAFGVNTWRFRSR